MDKRFFSNLAFVYYYLSFVSLYLSLSSLAFWLMQGTKVEASLSEAHMLPDVSYINFRGSDNYLTTLEESEERFKLLLRSTEERESVEAVEAVEEVVEELSFLVEEEEDGETIEDDRDDLLTLNVLALNVLTLNV